MELKEKIIRTTDANGNLNDLTNEPSIPVLINGKDNNITLEHIFRRYDLDQEDSTIYGTSLLSYFTPKDGKLVDAEGNTVEFLTSDRKPILIIDNTEEPDLSEDAEISFDYIQAFSELVGIKKPDELFADILTDDEKAIFVSARNVRDTEAKKIVDAENAKKQLETEAQQKIATEAQKIVNAEEAKKQADAEIVSKIEPDYLVDEKKYKKYQKFYEELQSFKEYIFGNVHLFYGDKWSEFAEDPFILIKRTEGYWEDAETDVDNIIEGEKTVELEYVDGGERKKLTLDVEKDEISVSDVAKA